MSDDESSIKSFNSSLDSTPERPKQPRGGISEHKQSAIGSPSRDMETSDIKGSEKRTRDASTPPKDTKKGKNKPTSPVLIDIPMAEQKSFATLLCEAFDALPNDVLDKATSIAPPPKPMKNAKLHRFLCNQVSDAEALQMKVAFEDYQEAKPCFTRSLQSIRKVISQVKQVSAHDDIPYKVLLLVTVKIIMNEYDGTPNEDLLTTASLETFRATVSRLAHTNPKAIFPCQGAYDKIPATNETRLWKVSVDTCGHHYPKDSKSTPSQPQSLQLHRSTPPQLLRQD